MSYFIFSMLSAGLDGDASGVEGDAFADQTEDGAVGGGVCWLVLHDDERGRLVGALGDAPEGSHFEFVELFCAKNLAFQAEFLRHFGCFLAQNRRCHAVSRLVDKAAGEVLRLADDDAFVEAGFSAASWSCVKTVSDWMLWSLRSER